MIPDVLKNLPLPEPRTERSLEIALPPRVRILHKPQRVMRELPNVGDKLFLRVHLGLSQFGFNNSLSICAGNFAIISAFTASAPAG
jgi:hypothetical protein